MGEEEALKYYPIPNHPNYFVTKKGNVYSTKSGVYKKLKPALHNAGYLAIILSTNNRIYNKDIHRLIAEILLDNWDPKLQVNHINGIKTDNRLENLEMCTQEENMKHAFDMGLSTGIGETHCNAKLTEKDVVQIKVLLKKAVLNQRTIARIFGVCEQTISNIKFNRAWRRV